MACFLKFLSALNFYREKINKTIIKIILAQASDIAQGIKKKKKFEERKNVDFLGYVTPPPGPAIWPAIASIYTYKYTLMSKKLY